MSTPATRASLDDARKRLTAGQLRAARYVIEHRADYGSLDDLCTAVALAVVTAEDDSSRRVAVVRNGDGSVYVFGPYASDATARKVLETGGFATTSGARAAVLPLIAAPRSPLSKAETAPPKRRAAKVTA